MFIESFRVDGFGILANVQVSQLSPGLSIFYGENEAGKSTCLEFLRAMLTGYRRKNKNERDVSPLRGGQAGGGLVIHSGTHGIVHLTRRPEGSTRLTLTRPDGTSLPPSVLDTMLAGVNQEVYRTVFGFSLDELQTLGNLNAGDVRKALYSASFGAGVRAPATVLQELSTGMTAIFKPSGIKTSLNAAFKTWDNLLQDIHKALGESASYDRLAKELAGTREELEKIRAERTKLDVERRKLASRLGAWNNWHDWREVCKRLEALPATAPNFPQGGGRRMEELLRDQENRQQQLAAHEAKWQRLAERMEAMRVDGALLEALPGLRRLAELKASYRQAMGELPQLEDKIERDTESLQSLLERLGDGWDCQRIRNTDRSIFAREDMDRQASEMTAAESSYKAAVDALTRANNEVGQAESDIEQIREELAAMPSPRAELDDEGRDSLRQQLARYEEGIRQMPENNHQLEAARTGFKRVWDPLRLAPLTAQTEPQQVLDNILQHQDAALALAEEVQQNVDKSDEANKTVTQAQEEADRAKLRLDVLVQAQESGTPTRESLGARSSALRQLRELTATLRGDRERLDDMKNRLETEKRPAANASIPLIVVGIVLCLAGASLLLAHLLTGMTSFALTPSLEVPVNLWSGYLVLVCGVAFLGGGLPRSGPEVKKYRQDMENLRSRVEASALIVQEKEDQARALCATAQVDSWDAAALAACEERLEQERERCLKEEHLLAEMGTIKQELAQANTRLGLAKARAHEQDAIVQHARRRWHEFMLGLKLGHVPAPEAAHRFFDHVGTARVAVDALVRAEEQCARHKGDMEALCRELAALPPVASRLPEGDRPDDTALVGAIRAVLEACREADAAREQRLQAQARLDARIDELSRAQTRQTERAAELHDSEERRKQAADAWVARLQNLGLGLDLAPDTVREAIKCMDDCLQLDASLATTAKAVAQSHAGTEALSAPLGDMLGKLGREPLPGADGAPDWLATLDSVLADAEDAARAQSERQHLAQQVAEAEDDVRASRAALAEVENSERELFSLAGVDNSEQFMRMATTVAEAAELQRQRQELEKQLRQAADGDLDTWLAAFASLDRAGEEGRLSDTEEQLSSLEKRGEDLRLREGELTAQVSRLRDGETLARLRQDASDQETLMANLARQWTRLALAHAIISETKARYERERQPAVMQEASRIFRQITDGRWLGINVSLDEGGSIRFLPADQSEPVGPEALSRGAREQAWLALRLAYIASHATQAEALPIIMDDVLVNFDPERALRTATAMARLASTGAGHQIFYFTCHPHMVDILRQAQPDAPLLTVSNGTITRSN